MRKCNSHSHSLSLSLCLCDSYAHTHTRRQTCSPLQTSTCLARSVGVNFPPRGSRLSRETTNSRSLARTHAPYRTFQAPRELRRGGARISLDGGKKNVGRGPTPSPLHKPVRRAIRPIPRVFSVRTRLGRRKENVKRRSRFSIKLSQI